MATPRSPLRPLGAGCAQKKLHVVPLVYTRVIEVIQTEVPRAEAAEQSPQAATAPTTRAWRRSAERAADCEERPLDRVRCQRGSHLFWKT